MAQDFSHMQNMGRIEEELMKIERYDCKTGNIETVNGPYRIMFKDEYCIPEGKFSGTPAICDHSSKTIVLYRMVWEDPLSWSMPLILHEVGHANDPEARSIKRLIMSLLFRSIYRKRIEEKVERFAENYADKKFRELQILWSKEDKR